MIVTGILQPADVGLQWVNKHLLKQDIMDFMIAAHQKQLMTGLKLENIKITTSIPTL